MTIILRFKKKKEKIPKPSALVSLVSHTCGGLGFPIIYFLTCVCVRVGWLVGS
jgi:hypothetical protein